MAHPSTFSGSIAENYEKYLGPVMFEPYAVDIAERVASYQPHKVLELACGTGRITRQLLEKVPSIDELVAMDISEDMLNVAKTSVEDRRISWRVADAQFLDFAENFFDIVVCQFGLMFFQDKEKALKQIYKVLKTSGVFIFNTWASIENNPRAVYTLKAVDEVLGDAAPNLLEKGPYSFNDKIAIKQLLESTGFSGIRDFDVRKVSAYPDIESLINGFIEGSPLSSLLKKFPDEKRMELHKKLQAEFSVLPPKEALEHPMLAYVFEGRKG